MSDDLLARLASLDTPRPLPPELSARLERVLTAEAQGMGELAAADRPRPIPDQARERLEETLVRVATVRPLPSPLRNRLERQLTRPQRTWQRVAVAAAVLFLLATTAAYVIEEDRYRERNSGTAAQSTSGDDALLGDVGGNLQGFDPSNDATGTGSAGASGGTSGQAAARLTRSHPGVVYRPYPAPPYSLYEMEFEERELSLSGEEPVGPPPEVRDPPPLPPLRLGVVGGDDVQEAGFRAYIALVNENGGAGGHRLDVVGAGAGDTVATVNLSRSPVADNAGPPVGTTTPLVESLDVLEPALRQAVYGLSSVPERQARLAVAAALGAGGAGTRAVIYTAATGSFASRIPDALEQALRARRADVVRVRWDPTIAPLLDAGVAFVSLPTDEARGWLRVAKSRAYAPAAGIWGIWSLADESLLADMSSNVRALSPYEFVSGDELRNLTTRTDRQPSARLVHGWATAKWLAVSIWSSKADDNAELARALSAEGFSSGFFPPLDYRPDSHARTPEAIVLRPRDGHLVAEGDFRRD